MGVWLVQLLWRIVRKLLKKLKIELLYDSTWRRASSPLQYSCLENPMDRGAWRATAHVVTKSWTRLSVSTLDRQASSWAYISKGTESGSWETHIPVHTTVIYVCMYVCICMYTYIMYVCSVEIYLYIYTYTRTSTWEYYSALWKADTCYLWHLAELFRQR